MADRYLDHGAYATALGAIPTWGVPQEGDGSAMEASSSSSIGSVLFNAVPTTGAFTICGVSPSVTGVLSAASVDAAANALAANINATTTAVVSTVAVGVPQLRNLVYARGPSGGAPAGTCQIMMRVGSGTLNHASNSSVAMAHTFNGTPPTITQFAGGVGGCWGYLFNSTALGVSNSLAALSYGFLVGASPMVWTSTPTAYETTWARTGSGKTISYSAAASFSVTNSGTWPMRLVFDSNTVWTSDSGDGVFLLDLTLNNASSNVSFSPAGSGRQSFVGAVKRGGLKISFSCSFSNSNLSLATGAADNGQVIFHNIDIEDKATQTSTVTRFGSNYLGSVTCRGLRYTRTVASTSLSPILSPATYFNQSFVFEGCSFAWNITGVSDPGPVVNITNPAYYGCSIRFSGCDFSGWPSGNDKFTVIGSGAASGSAYVIVVDNCTGVKLTSSYAGIVQPLAAHDPGTQAMYSFQSGEVGGAFRYEQRNGITEWDPDSSPAYPTLGALLPDLATPWSLRVIWPNVNGPTNTNPLRAAQLRVVNRMADAARTLSIRMFYRSALHSVLAGWQISVMVTYIDASTGVAVTEFLTGGPSASGDSWANAASWSGYSPYKVEITTASAVKQNTEVIASIRIHGAPATAQNENVFINPEIIIT